MRINAAFVVGILALIATMLSCSRSNLVSEQDLKSYLVDEVNGLHKIISNGDVEIEVTYRPAELLWINELREMKDEHSREQLRKTYDSLNYFVLQFSRKGKEIENLFVSDRRRFTEVVNYLSFEMAGDIYLVQQRDTIRAIDVVHARTFGGSKGTTVMAVFNSSLKTKGEDIKICFNDRKLGIGAVAIEFKQLDINNIPKLILN